jgi:hypothetical protein
VRIGQEGRVAIHEVWVKRIVVLEERVVIPVEVEPEDLARFDERHHEFATRKVARDRAIAHARQMVTDQSWSKLARVEELVVGELKIDHVSEDML